MTIGSASLDRWRAEIQAAPRADRAKRYLQLVASLLAQRNLNLVEDAQATSLLLVGAQFLEIFVARPISREASLANEIYELAVTQLDTLESSAVTKVDSTWEQIDALLARFNDGAR